MLKEELVTKVMDMHSKVNERLIWENTSPDEDALLSHLSDELLEVVMLLHGIHQNEGGYGGV